MNTTTLTSAKIEPAVLKMIDQINALLVEAVGPIGLELAKNAFARWLAAGKLGASGLRRYIKALGEQIEDASSKENFLSKADRLLLRLQTSQ